jgi:hypothetical protein
MILRASATRRRRPAVGDPPSATPAGTARSTTAGIDRWLPRGNWFPGGTFTGEITPFRFPVDLVTVDASSPEGIR